MSNIHALQLSVKLNELERRIRDAKVVKFEKLPTEQNLAIRKIIEYAKPTRTLGEMIEDASLENKRESDSDEQLHEELPEAPEEKSEQFKESFREVLRLAKSGQQSWWTDKLKNSTNAHIECMDEYYRQNYSNETID